MGATEQRAQQVTAAEWRQPGHCGQPLHAAAAQQLQQQRLRLVVPVLGGQQVVPLRQPGFQHGIACRPRRGLAALAGDGTAIHLQGDIMDTESGADGAAMLIPGARHRPAGHD